MSNKIPRYSFVIKDASGNLYEFEKCVSRAWEWYENDVGRCRFFIPHNDVKLSATSVPDGAFSEIRIYREGILVWQGLVQIVQDTMSGTWVYGETFMAALKWYGTRYNQLHTTDAIGDIIGLEYDNIETRTSNFLTAKITQGTIQNPYIFNTTSDLTITRTLYNDNFFDFMQEMVGVARGEMTPAWEQYAVFNISFHETTPTFSFLRNVGDDENDVVFELDSEIIDFNIPRDFRSIATYTKGLAIKEGPEVLTKEVTNATPASAWYRREIYPFFNSATDQADLDQRTDNLATEVKDPRRDMNLKFAAGLVPFDGYDMGDNVRIRMNRGRVNINELRRVVGMEVTIADTGIEQTVPILEKLRT